MFLKMDADQARHQEKKMVSRRYGITYTEQSS